MKIGIGSDHAGFCLKEQIRKALIKTGYDVVDFGTRNNKSVDYSDYAVKVARAVAFREIDRGILICGTGIGMSITANKIRGIRAALCNDLFCAKLSRLHNDANILAMGGRILAGELAWEITQTFLETPFTAGKHLRRVNKIKALEKEL